MALIENCEAALALPGGPGTLAEIATMWSLLLTNSISPRQLILIGSGWQVTFQQFFSSLGDYVPEIQRKWLSFVPDVTQALAALNHPPNKP